MPEQGTANPICVVIYGCYFYAEKCTEILVLRFMRRCLEERGTLIWITAPSCQHSHYSVQRPKLT